MAGGRALDNEPLRVAASPSPRLLVRVLPQRRREETDMTHHFTGRKLIVVGGSSGMGKEAAADVVAGGGSVVLVGREQARVDETVAELSKDGPAVGLTADLADRAQVDFVREVLAGEHADATLLVNA